MHVGTGKAAESNELLTALQRGRYDHEFFGAEFLGRPPHPGQLKFLENATATVNCLATANRWGKTTVLSHLHFHSGIYKTGAESRYMKDDELDLEAFIKVKYHTIHTADGWETVALVWDEAHKLMKESKALSVWIPAGGAPRSLPPHIDFITGSRWKFRTLGHDASGIDGDSFYKISVDEAGWVAYLEEKMRNVIRVRVADVRGCIYLVGTFKPGISKDFYAACVRASAHTGIGLGFDHRDDADDGAVSGGLDASIIKYVRDYGIDLSEYADALRGQI